MSHVAFTIKRLKKTRIGLIAYTALGMYTGTLDHITLEKVFCPKLVQLDQFLLINEIEKIKNDEISDLNEFVTESAKLIENVSGFEIHN